jgi:uncharacterized cofD-like protein
MAKLTRLTTPPNEGLQSPLRIVSIGGGTGLSTLLSGLKRHAKGTTEQPVPGKPVIDITAVVTVSDDGGSSGRLRREFAVLPPGDIRNCMTALSEDEHLLSQLFRYRFASGKGLKGHSFGNLFLTAMNEITGDFSQAVKLSCEILAIRGRIFPATSSKVSLEATMEDGTVVSGESKISSSKQRIARIQLLPPDCEPLPETLEAINKADLITLGPGSLYTSVIPNLLVAGIPDAIEQSPATKVCFVNLMWQPGETSHLTASEHVEAVLRHAYRKIVDVAVVNSAPIPSALKRRYARAHVQPVANDLERLEGFGIRVVEAELLDQRHDRIRHSPEALAEVTIDLASRSRATQVRKLSVARRQHNFR